MADVFLKVAHKNIFAYRNINIKLIHDIFCENKSEATVFLKKSCFKNVFYRKTRKDFSQWWRDWSQSAGRFLWICVSRTPTVERHRPETARQPQCGKSSHTFGRDADEQSDEKRSYFSPTTRVWWSHRTLINSSCRFVSLLCLSVNYLIVSPDIRHGADRVSSHRPALTNRLHIDSMPSNAATSILIQCLNIKVCQNESWRQTAN